MLQAASSNAETKGVTRVLYANESAVVRKADGSRSHDAVVIAPAPSVRPADFMRMVHVPPTKTLNLLDVVAGGDGFGYGSDRGIDPATGNQEMKFLTTYRHASGRYHRVTFSPLIDGVFIPDGRKGPMQMDSAGLGSFHFPAAEGETYGPIWVRDVWGTPDGVPLDAGRYWFYSFWPDRSYVPRGRGLLGLHANAGITFSLEAIRQRNPGFQIVRLCAATGNVGRKEAAMADIWVFVDGQPVFSRKSVAGQGGPFAINVPLDPKSRFVTFAATQSRDNTAKPPGKGFNNVWVVFGDPALTLRTNGGGGTLESTRASREER